MPAERSRTDPASAEAYQASPVTAKELPKSDRRVARCIEKLAHSHTVPIEPDARGTQDTDTVVGSDAGVLHIRAKGQGSRASDNRAPEGWATASGRVHTGHINLRINLTEAIIPYFSVLST